jgi:hypothetical protein
MGEKPSLTQLCPLWHGPNGLVANFLTINAFLPVQVIGLMIILFPTMSQITVIIVTLSRYQNCEVPCDTVLISRRSSNFAKFSSAKFPMEPSITFQSYLSSYLVF